MEFTAFGPILLAQQLIEDDFGTLSRAWERDGLGGIRPILLRRFAPGMGLPSVIQALEHSLRAPDLPATCGKGHQFGLHPEPHWKVDHRKSRSLRRIQEQCRAEQFPLDLGLSLHLAYTLAHVCARFWRLGLSVGPLSLDSLRVDFEGSLFLPDLGWLPTLIQEADETPALRQLLPGLPRGPVAGDLGGEAQRFGTFLYELITFEALPAGLSPKEAMAQARTWTPDGPVPIPDRILQGLARLMHVLFRQNLEQQTQQLEREASVLADFELWPSAPASAPEEPVVATPNNRSYGRLAGGGLLAFCLGVGGLLFLQRQDRARQSPKAQRELPAAPEPKVQQPREPVPPLREAKPVATAPAPPARAAATPMARPIPEKKELAAASAPKAIGAVPARSKASEPLDRPAQLQVRSRMVWPQDVPRVAVIMKVFVHEDGHALRATAELGNAAGPKVLKAATEAALKSRYLPALRNGQPMRDWVEVQFTP